MSDLISRLELAFEKLANPDFADRMSSYLKNQFEFYGIKQGPRRQVVKDILKSDLPNYDDVPELIQEMYSRNEREWHYSAIDLMLKYKKLWKSSDIDLVEWMCVNHSWWDTVDGISIWIAGELLGRHKDLAPQRPNEWIESDNLWLQRMAIIFQLKYRNELDFELLKRYILRRADSKEFFIQKASGWALREQSKYQPNDVIAFAEAHPELAALTKREALRLIKKKS